MSSTSSSSRSPAVSVSSSCRALVGNLVGPFVGNADGRWVLTNHIVEKPELDDGGISGKPNSIQNRLQKTRGKPVGKFVGNLVVGKLVGYSVPPGSGKPVGLSV